MAKQNVTFVERHLEKIVAGTAGAVLLFVLVTNVLLSPHAIETGGESHAPGTFYPMVADQAAETQRRMEIASGVPPEIQEKSKRLQDMLKLTAKPYPLDLPVAAVPLSPPMPEVTGGPVWVPVGKINVAEILPPTQPILMVGKAAARLAVPRLEEPGSMPDASTEELTTTTDLHWVTGAGIIDRKSQRERFGSADYLSDLRELLVAEIRVERREQMPNGLWGSPEVIQPYVSRRLRAKTSVDIVTEDTGYAVSDTDGKYITDLRQLLEGKETQARILRPPFQSFLTDTDPAEDDTAEWRIPTSLKAPNDTEVDMTDTEFGVSFFDERGQPLSSTIGGGYTTRVGMGPGGKPGAPYGGADATAGGAAVSAVKRIQEAQKQAEERIRNNKPLEAKAILEELAAASDLNAQQKRQIDELLKQYRTVFERAEILASRQQQTGGSTEQQMPDLDPFWFTDISVVPGKTYQYRTSTVALNQYAGMANRVKEVDDARRLVIQGQWSEWSKAVTVPPAKYMFVMSVASDGGGVGVELCEWKGGTWERLQNKLLPGDAVMATGRGGRLVLDYGAVLVSADPLRPFVRRSPLGRSDAVRYASENTGVAVLVNALGNIEEHFVAEDAERRTEVARQITEERKRREATRQPGVTPVQPQRTLRQPPGREFGGEEPRPTPGGGHRR